MQEQSKKLPENYSRLESDEIALKLKELSSAWTVLQERCLYREFHFKNFKEALAFTNQIGAIAEEEKHHPDIYLSYHEVGIKLFTHDIGALSPKDFKVAKLVESEYSTFI